jgi:hypothetical protein
VKPSVSALTGYAVTSAASLFFCPEIKKLKTGVLSFAGKKNGVIVTVSAACPYQRKFKSLLCKQK